MDQLTHQSREMAAAQDAAQLRSRGKQMLELATRAYCEQHYDFARLLTQLATEVFTHAKDVERAPCAISSSGGLRRRPRHRA